MLLSLMVSLFLDDKESTELIHSYNKGLLSEVNMALIDELPINRLVVGIALQ